MSRKTNAIWVVVALVLVAMGLATIVAQFIAMSALASENAAVMVVSSSINALALIFAAVYLLAGYGKKNAGQYKAFLGFFGLSCLVVLLGLLAGSGAFFSANALAHVGYGLIVAITLACVITLFLAKDLGKKKSTMLAALPMCLFALAAIFILIFSPAGAGEEKWMNTLAAMVSGRFFTLSYILTVCVDSKYVDKAERGAK